MEKWGNAEIEVLTNLYQENNVPSDELIKDKDVLAKFVETLNQRIGTGKNYTEKEVADKLLKLRKTGKLPRIRK
jgi:RNA polymerase-interacting CarD/CdnL/TRCF family regulator